MEEGYSLLKDSLPRLRAAYEASPQKGDRLIELLAKNARNTIDDGQKGLVPLEEELKELEDLIALYASLHPQEPKDIVFDIDETEDFLIPAHSIVSACYYMLNNSKDDAEYLVLSIDEDDLSIVFSGPIYDQVKDDPNSQKLEEVTKLRRAEQ